MALNPSIPLAVNTVDTATPINSVADSLRSNNLQNYELQRQQNLDANAVKQQQFENTRNTQNDAARNALLAQQTLLAHWQAVPEEAKANFVSTAMGATQLKPFLDNNDVKGATDFLEQRRQQIKGRGGNTAETDHALSILQSGDPDAIKSLNNDVNGVLAAGQALGFLRPPEVKSVGYGEKLVNTGTGGTVATGPDVSLATAPKDSSGKPLGFEDLLKAPPTLETNHAIASHAIATGQVKVPYLRSAESRAVWEQTIADMMRTDPTANVNRSANMLKFDTGKQGDTIRSFSVAAAHMDTLSQLANALNNGDTQAINALSNTFKTQFGDAVPTNFNAAKKFVADEVTKGVIGSSGALGDREETLKAISSASSPAQLAGIVKTWKELMGGQLEGYGRQYELGTGKKDFRDRLSPAAQSIYDGAVNKAKQPADNAGWAIKKVD